MNPYRRNHLEEKEGGEEQHDQQDAIRDISN